MNGHVDFSGLGDGARGQAFENLGHRQQALDSGRYQSSEGRLEETTEPSWGLPHREPRIPDWLPDG